MSFVKILIVSTLVLELENYVTDAKGLHDISLNNQYITNENIDIVTNDGTANFIYMQYRLESNGVQQTGSK